MEPAGDWKDREVPTWVVLQRLASVGWSSSGKRPKTHTVTTLKCYGPQPEPVACRYYLRCVLGLLELLTDQLLGLPSAQLASYYHCVLQVKEPEAVPVGLKGNAYGKVMRVIAAGKFPHALEDELGPAPMPA